MPQAKKSFFRAARELLRWVRRGEPATAREVASEFALALQGERHLPHFSYMVAKRPGFRWREGENEQGRLMRAFDRLVTDIAENSKLSPTEVCARLEGLVDD